jgi:hypothetical protein
MHKENIHTPTPTLMKETVSCMFVHPSVLVYTCSPERPVRLFRVNHASHLNSNSRIIICKYPNAGCDMFMCSLCFGTAEGYYLCTSPPKPLSTSYALSSVSVVDNGSFSDLVCFVRNFAGALFGECSSSRRGILPILVWKLASVLNP